MKAVTSFTGANFTGCVIPDKHCTHIHEAKRIYYKGRA